MSSTASLLPAVMGIAERVDECIEMLKNSNVYERHSHRKEEEGKGDPQDTKKAVVAEHNNSSKQVMDSLQPLQKKGPGNISEHPNIQLIDPGSLNERGKASKFYYYNPSSSKLNTNSFFLRVDANTPAISNTVSTNDLATAPQKEERKRFRAPSDQYLPVPVDLILYASLLVAAVSRAFPSAHQSLHLSLYFWWMGFSGGNFDDTGARIGGGYLATGVALAYYYVWYVRAGRKEDDDRNEKGEKKKKSLLRRNFIDEMPVFMKAQLRLPDYAKMKV